MRTNIAQIAVLSMFGRKRPGLPGAPGESGVPSLRQFDFEVACNWRGRPTKHVDRCRID